MLVAAYISAFTDASLSSVHFRKAIGEEIYFDGVLDVVSNNDNDSVSKLAQ